MISRCSSPRKPQRKPKPSAAEVSISKEKLASLRRSLPIAARKSSKSAASTGNRPQNTTGIAGRKPGSGAATGLRSSVMVSPTRVSATSLIEAVRKPISPGPSSSTRSQLGREHADAVDVVGGVGAHHADALALFHHAVDDAHQHHDAEIGVVPAIDQQRLQRRVAVALRRRQAGDDGFQHFRQCSGRSWPRSGSRPRHRARSRPRSAA